MKYVLIYWFLTGFATGGGVYATGQVEFWGKETCEKALEEFMDKARRGYTRIGNGICVSKGN